MQFGLNENTIKNIIEIIKRFEEIEKVIIFGSRAKGNFSKGSDIDLALFGKKVDSEIIRSLTLQFDESGIPNKFDLVHYEAISNDDLKAHIDRVGKIVYEKT